MPLGRDFPAFPGCTAVLFSGPLSPGAIDHIDTADGRVRVIHVVPVTEAERAQADGLSPNDAVTALMAEVDIFAPRTPAVSTAPAVPTAPATWTA